MLSPQILDGAARDWNRTVHEDDGKLAKGSVTSSRKTHNSNPFYSHPKSDEPLSSEGPMLESMVVTSPYNLLTTSPATAPAQKVVNRPLPPIPDVQWVILTG